MEMVFFKSHPELQTEGDHLKSFDDANISFILASFGWVYFKMLWFDDFFNSSRVKVSFLVMMIWVRIPRMLQLWASSLIDLGFWHFLSRWWCSLYFQKCLENERIFLILWLPWYPSITLIFESLSVPYWAALPWLVTLPLIPCWEI